MTGSDSGPTASAAPDIGPRLAQVRARNTYSLASHATPSGREHHTVTAPKRGPNRERARRAILGLLRRAHHQQHRVAFTITFTDGSRLRLGGKAGYDPDRALTQCHIERDDPFAWLKEQLAERHPTTGGTTIIGVDLDTWPTLTPT
jgi:hypothetical protein